MNRYVADGLLADLRDGKRVLYVGPTLDYARELLDQLADRLQPGEKAYRANGAERIEQTHGSGVIAFRSIRSSVRGRAADVVVIDADPTHDQWAEIAPCVTGGELIRL